MTITNRSTIPDFPVIRLVGGPYDGLIARRGEGSIDGVHFLPESVIVKGGDGTATYALEHGLDETTGNYTEGE